VFWMKKWDGYHESRIRFINWIDIETIVDGSNLPYEIGAGVIRTIGLIFQRGRLGKGRPIFDTGMAPKDLCMKRLKPCLQR